MRPLLTYSLKLHIIIVTHLKTIKHFVMWPAVRPLWRSVTSVISKSCIHFIKTSGSSSAPRGRVAKPHIFIALLYVLYCDNANNCNSSVNVCYAVHMDAGASGAICHYLCRLEKHTLCMYVCTCVFTVPCFVFVEHCTHCIEMAIVPIITSR